jgi:hypothetical protein
MATARAGSSVKRILSTSQRQRTTALLRVLCCCNIQQPGCSFAIAITVMLWQQQSSLSLHDTNFITTRKRQEEPQQKSQTVLLWHDALAGHPLWQQAPRHHAAPAGRADPVHAVHLW